MKLPDKDFFSANRRRVGRSLEGGILVLAAHDSLQSVSDMAQPFRQENNFLYLSGLNSPRWKMVYDSARDYCWLIRPHYSQVEILFDGALGDEAALSISGANQVIDQADFESLLRQQARSHSAVYGLEPLNQSDHSFVLNPAPARLWTQLKRNFSSTIDARQKIAAARAVKQPIEIAFIEQAITITAKAFEQARNQARELKSEYELEAIFSSQFRAANSRHAYDPIVASGENALQLHYNVNSQKFGRRNLALCDVGAEFAGYAADVTRMISLRPVNQRQKLVYSALFEAQRAIIDEIETSMPVAQYHQMVDRHMHTALQRLGLMSSKFDEATYRRYFPHAVSHGLGLDVHDSLAGTRTLDESMVLTVEPGIYISEEGIGMRIEDDILITKSGVRNLSAKISTSLD